MDRVDILTQILLDKSIVIDDRDDAAMDLADYDDDRALRTLVKAGGDISDDEMVLNSCGESIAEILIRRNQLITEIIWSLAQPAREGVLIILRNQKPEWFEQLDHERK